MIISLGLHFTDGGYKMFIEGVMGSFDLDWMEDLEESVAISLDEFISDSEETVGYPNEVYINLIMEMKFGHIIQNTKQLIPSSQGVLRM